ncbi:MAG: hypothetical protein NVS3B21_10950 [Acidimicrobiales bacterium]
MLDAGGAGVDGEQSGMDRDAEGPWRGTDAAQGLPVGRRSLIVVLATVPVLGIGIVLLAVAGLKTVLIDVGLRQPDVQAPVLAWLSPCGRRLITGTDAATTTVERGHHPHETLQQDGRGFPLRRADQSSGSGGTCSSSIDSTPIPNFLPHQPLSMLGPVEIDLPNGRYVSKFSDSGPQGRTMFIAIDTTASATDALAMLDSQLRVLGYHPASKVSGVTTYDGNFGTVSTHIASLHDHKATVVVAQHAPPINNA